MSTWSPKVLTVVLVRFDVRTSNSTGTTSFRSTTSTCLEYLESNSAVILRLHQRKWKTVIMLGSKWPVANDCWCRYNFYYGYLCWVERQPIFKHVYAKCFILRWLTLHFFDSAGIYCMCCIYSMPFLNIRIVYCLFYSSICSPIYCIHLVATQFQL